MMGGPDKASATRSYAAHMLAETKRVVDARARVLEAARAFAKAGRDAEGALALFEDAVRNLEAAERGE